MPINFSQPEPMAPGITAGAAAAEFAAKTFPTIAQIYENAARLRASGGGGGGHGGVVQGGGPVQVLPSGDAGAGLYQVEAQANREQRAMDLGFEYQQDLVGRHIDKQQQFRMQEQQRQQDFLTATNPNARVQGPIARPQASPEPPPTTFGPEDETQLAAATQGISDLRLKANMVPPAAFSQMMAPLEQNRDTLLAKKRQADQDAVSQKHQMEMREDLHQAALVTSRGQALVNHMPKDPLPEITDINQVPGMPKRTFSVKNGEWVPDNDAMRIAVYNGYEKRRLESIKAQTKDPIIEQKLEQTATDHYLKIRQHEIDRLNKEEDKFMADAEKAGGKRERATPEGFDNTVAERMKAHGLPGTLQESIDQHRASRGQPAQPTQQDRELVKQANPEAVSSFQAHVNTMPRLPTGQPDLLRSSPQQLDQFAQYYSPEHAKQIGASPEIAARWRAAIAQARAAQQRAPVEDFEHPAPGGATGEAIDTFAGGTGMAGARIFGRAMYNAPKTARALPGTAASAVGALATAPEQARAAGRRIGNEASGLAGGAYLNFKRWLSGE